jgi:peptidoglycan-N-acetylglucosamine deacetylase
MFIHKTNFLMRAFYPDFIWKMSESQKVIYLTFDDGPIPEVTEFVLEQLDIYNAKATFFCIGENIVKNPQIFEQLLKAEHSIGNHTHNHVRGWDVEDDFYVENFKKCQEMLPESTLFRPPYGRIKKNQAKEILGTHQIVMWDVLSGDYSLDISPENVLKKTIQHTENGSIILFHDSKKAEKNLRYALPKFLKHFAENGFQFAQL